MQKHVNLVDLVKSFPTNIYLQNLASIQKRTSPVKFVHLAEKSGKGSISNLSTKARTAHGSPQSVSDAPHEDPLAECKYRELATEHRAECRGGWRGGGEIHHRK